MSKRYSEEIRQQIVQMYEQGMSAPQIARQLGMHHRGSTVYRILKHAAITPSELLSTGVRLGEVGGYHRFSEPTEEQIALQYLNGQSTRSLAQQWSCDVGTIRRLLKRQQVFQRRQGNRARIFTDSEADQIITEYQAGASIHALAHKTGIMSDTIRTLLLSHGVSLHRVAKLSKLSEEQITHIYERWHAGESQESIANDLKLHQTSISRVLQLRIVAFDPSRARGETHGSWKGGRVKTQQGYIMVLVRPDDPYFSMANQMRYIAEHRLMMAKALGRPLGTNETVHHIDGDPSHNDLSNLQLRLGRHGKHGAYCCLDCGSSHIGPVPLANGAAPEQLRLLEG